MVRIYLNLHKDQKINFLVASSVFNSGQSD